MENVSKALIVAGSVILAVLIITLGMYFYNQSTTTGKGLNMTEYEIKQFNSKFKMYEGKINASQAKELKEAVERHNTSVGKDGAGVLAWFSGYSIPGTPAGVPSDKQVHSTMWFDDYATIYNRLFLSDIENEMIDGTTANERNKNLYSPKFIVENGSYCCHLLYCKKTGLITAVYVTYPTNE